MPWNSTSPIGSVSVKNNRTTMNQNTAYIETTMGNSIIGTNTDTTRDHFWNVGGNEDGRHRFINSPAFTVGGNPADPVLGAGMDGVCYLKSDGLTPSRVGGYYRNAQNIYQYIPIFLTGTTVLTSSFSTIVALPAGVYGEIYLFTTLEGEESGQAGFFKTNATVCDGWSYGERVQGGSTAIYPVRLGNGSDANLLNLRARSDAASSGLTWNYRITYRAI